MKWFTLTYWKYLFSPRNPDYYWWTVILCRIKEHPMGVRWYTLTRDTPDMRCWGCGDDLG